MKLKVCGMKYQDNIAEVAALQPDYMGLIFYEKSARFLQNEIPKVSKNIKKTGVFVDASLNYIIEQIDYYKLQAIQLHGSETPEFCEKLNLICHSALDAESRTKDDEILNRVQDDKKVEIIKVFSIKDTFNFSVLEPYESVCDYYLFDTKGKLPGGNGYTFNWSVLENYPSTKPYFLSGGIGLDEIGNIKEFQKSNSSKYCYAIDVNSGFEIEPGLKNIEKIKEFKKQLSF
jgi:phosphoribosylanthranilate isomerase